MGQGFDELGEEPRRLGQADVEEWLAEGNGDGWFTYDDIYRDLTVVDNTNKDTVRKAISRLVTSGRIKGHPDIKRKFRAVGAEAELMNWQGIPEGRDLKLLWPFGLEKYIKMFSGNVAVIAGDKDAGKTAYCFKFIVMNMFQHDIVYLTSEMAEEELAERLGPLGEGEWRFEARRLRGHPADSIQPTKINIIDYLELSDNFFQVAGKIREVFDRLTTGIAIICLQKDYNADSGRGKAFSEEKARLYLTMDVGKRGEPSKLTIKIGKNRKDPAVNPKGMAWNYKLVDGCRFVNVTEILPDWPE